MKLMHYVVINDMTVAREKDCMSLAVFWKYICHLFFIYYSCIKLKIKLWLMYTT